MENITRTGLLGWLQTHTLMGLSMRYMKYTTLNEKYDIQKDILPGANEYPFMRYYTIGYGGHDFERDADGTPVPRPVQHTAEDFGPFNGMPFVLREVSADLSPAERAKYCLRQPNYINQRDGKTYIAYWGKRINVATAKVAMQTKIKDGDNPVIIEDYVPNSSNLNPPKPELNNTGANIIEGKTLLTTTKIMLQFTRPEIDELLNVARIMFNNENRAIISEIQLVAGKDYTIQATNPGSASFQFNEVVGSMVVAHINSFYPANFSNGLIEANIDVGAAEPLFRLRYDPGTLP